MKRSKENSRDSQRDRDDKVEESLGCYSWNLFRVMAETRELEMKLLIYESDEIFREVCQKMRQTKETHLADPDCEEAESE